MSSKSDPATRGDLDDLGTALRGGMKTLGAELRGETTAMGAEVRDEMKAMGAEVRDEIHWLGARFEQLDSKVTAFGEGLMGLREHVTVEMRALREELSARIANVEDAVKETNTSVSGVRADVADLRRRFDRYEESSDLEKRVVAIEEQLGIAQKP